MQHEFYEQDLYSLYSVFSLLIHGNMQTTQVVLRMLSCQSVFTRRTSQKAILHRMVILRGTVTTSAVTIAFVVRTRERYLYTRQGDNLKHKCIVCLGLLYARYEIAGVCYDSLFSPILWSPIQRGSGKMGSGVVWVWTPDTPL